VSHVAFAFRCAEWCFFLTRCSSSFSRIIAFIRRSSEVSKSSWFVVFLMSFCSVLMRDVIFARCFDVASLTSLVRSSFSFFQTICGFDISVLLVMRSRSCCAVIPNLTNLFCRSSLFNMPNGQAHLPVPRCGVPGGANFTWIILWSVGTMDLYAFQFERLCLSVGEA